jgi:phage shock protein C
MQASATAQTPKRRDSLFGVCDAIGEDFGFNADILRVAVTASLLWNPLVVVIAYATAGLFVLASRKMFPKRKPAMPVAVPATPAREEALAAQRESAYADSDMPLARAA